MTPTRWRGRDYPGRFRGHFYGRLMPADDNFLAFLAFSFLGFLGREWFSAGGSAGGDKSCGQVPHYWRRRNEKRDCRLVREVLLQHFNHLIFNDLAFFCFNGE